MYCRPVCTYGIALLIALTFARSAFADAPIGAVAEPNTKDTIAIPVTGASRDLHYQAAVFRNDTVVTRDLGTSLQFTDETLLHVSSNSSVVLDSFTFEPGSGTLDGTVKLGVGVFRLVSGALVKHDNLQLVTPVTTLTIRGTDLVVAVEKDGTTRLRLYEGSIRVKTCNGAIIWLHPNERMVISPITCIALLTNADTNALIATAGDGGTGSGSGSGTGGGDPGSGGGDPGSGGGTGTGGDPGSGGDPGTGGGTTSGGDPSSGHDPGTGNSDGAGDSGQTSGHGNGGTNGGNGNGGDPGKK
jgi:FecR-like protein